MINVLDAPMGDPWLGCTAFQIHEWIQQEGNVVAMTAEQFPRLSCLLLDKGATEVFWGLLTRYLGYKSIGQAGEDILMHVIHSKRYNVLQKLTDKGFLELAQIKKYRILCILVNERDSRALRTILETVDDRRAIQSKMISMSLFPCTRAVWVCDEEMLRALLDSGFDPDECPSHGTGALEASMQTPRALPCLEALISAEVDVYAPKKPLFCELMTNPSLGYSAMHLKSMVSQFIRGGADIYDALDYGSILKADQSGFDLWSFALEEYSIYTRSSAGNTAIGLAALNLPVLCTMEIYSWRRKIHPKSVFNSAWRWKLFQRVKNAAFSLNQRFDTTQ